MNTSSAASRWLFRSLALPGMLVVGAVMSHLSAAPPPAPPAAGEKTFEVPASEEGQPGAGPIRQTDKYKELWRTRRAAWAKQVAGQQGTVVFLGDSITQGWQDDFGNRFPGMKLANRGISSDTTRGMLIRLEDVIALHPKAVVMLMGTNDLAEKAAPDVIAGNLKLIIAALKQHNSSLPIILCQVFPSSDAKDRPAANVKALNAAYLEAVKGDPQITVIDTWTLFADAEGNARKEEFPDLLHPNAAGYDKWAAALKPVFATLGLTETEPDTFKPEPGFVSLFNGKDLTGWGTREAKTLQPLQSFDGRTTSDDGRYAAINGRIVVKTPPEGRKVQQLWTTQEFGQDFVLKLEFRATPNADSGVFIRKPQLQCRDYPLAGPYKTLQKYKPQDWNEMVVTVKGGVAHCTCNGEILEAALAVPESGPIGLEGDRGQMEYRRIRLQQTP